MLYLTKLMAETR